MTPKGRLAMPHLLRHPLRNIGRRGAILITFGLTWLFIGVASLGVPSIPGTDVLWFEQWPEPYRVAAWALPGVIAIGYAWAPRNSTDWPGFTALYIAPFLRLLSYMTGWVDSRIPGHVGYPRGLVAGVIYALILVLLVICSGWQEPRRSLERGAVE